MFSQWIRTFLEEKCLDQEELLTVEGPSGENCIPLGCLVEAMDQASEKEQAGIKDTIVRLDFANADVMGYFRHLAKAIAI